jgi:hypothetical protein
MREADDAMDYRYPRSRILLTYLMIPALALGSTGLGVFLFVVGSIFVGALLFVFGIWFAFIGAFGVLKCSAIRLDSKGIEAHNFGRILKTANWQHVKKAKKVRRWNAGSRSFEDAYYVFDGPFSALRERMVNLRGPIAFDEKIRGLRALLDKINAAAVQYDFPLIVSDQEASIKLARLAGISVWSRFALEAKEVQVAAF